MTEAQAGGQAGKSTADHINILNSIINHSKRKKKQNLYTAFLDVTEAYDKAWLNAITYVHSTQKWTGRKKLENSKRTKQQSNSKSKNKVWTNQNNTDQGQYTTRRCTISDRVCQPDG